jgi:uncharacterized membrane protein
MNQAHFHLVVNHLPIIFPLVGLIVILVGIFTKSEVVKRTAYLIFILSSIATVFAMNSGEGAEEVVESIPDVSENNIEKHEEFAEIFSILSYALGLISLAGIWASLKGKSISKIISILCILMTVITLYFAKQTGTTGGEIRHSEIRKAQDATNSSSQDTEEDED